MRIKILDVIRELTEKILRMESKVLRWKLLIGNCTNELDGMPHAKNNSSHKRLKLFRSLKNFFWHENKNNVIIM